VTLRAITNESEGVVLEVVLELCERPVRALVHNLFCARKVEGLHAAGLYSRALAATIHTLHAMKEDQPGSHGELSQRRRQRDAPQGENTPRCVRGQRSSSSRGVRDGQQRGETGLRNEQRTTWLCWRGGIRVSEKPGARSPDFFLRNVTPRVALAMRSGMTPFGRRRPTPPLRTPGEPRRTIPKRGGWGECSFSHVGG
jgi:hypothetical protein